MKKLTMVIGVLCAISVQVACAANTWYVNNRIGNFGYDGKSPVVADGHGPKYKIQEAVDVAADGDTILVAPGTYGDDQGVVPSGACDEVNYNQCRVLVKKNLTIRSMGGKEVTHIVGTWGESGNEVASAIHANSISCIAIAKSAKDARIEGFTIRNGACAAKNAKLASGVTYLYSSSMRINDRDSMPTPANLPFVVDCVISNCTSKVGAIQMINGVRCHICYNRGGAATFSAVECCNLLYSVVAHNGTETANSCPLRSGGYIVNCTFSDIGGDTTSDSVPAEFYNCLQTDCCGAIYATVAKNNCTSAGFRKGGGADDTLTAGENVNCPQVGIMMASISHDYRLVKATPGFCANTTDQAIGCGREGRQQ